MKTDIAAVFRIRIRIRVFFTDLDPDKSGSVRFINLGDLNDCFDKVLIRFWRNLTKKDE